MDLQTKTKRLLEHAITANRIRPEHAKGMLESCHNWSQYAELVKLANADEGFELTDEERAVCERFSLSENEYRTQLVAVFREEHEGIESGPASADEVQRALAFCQAEKASR